MIIYVFPNQNSLHLIFYLVALTVLCCAFSLGLILFQAFLPFGMFREQRLTYSLVMSLSGTPKKWGFTEVSKARKSCPSRSSPPGLSCCHPGCLQRTKCRSLVCRGPKLILKTDLWDNTDLSATA